MGIKFFDIRDRAFANEAVLDGHNDLRDDFQRAVHKHIERVGDDAFGCVLDGHDAVFGAVFFHLGEHFGDGFLRSIAEAGAEAAHGGLVRVRGLGAEEGDLESFLQRNGAAHHFAINVA